MAVTYGFYNSLGKDRVYNAEQMSAIFDGVITDGVFASIGGKLIPTAGSGMQVIVKPGKCWFNSTWTVNDSELPLSIPAADVSLTRIDAIAVQINSAINTRANSIRIIQGTASANPAKPTLISSPTLHQYALGYVTVPANATSISASNIEVNVGKSTCPFVTSVLQQTNIDDLFNQWNSQFLTWFNNVQSQLSGNVAANLQAQIEAITQDGYGKNGVVSTITINSSIRQLYSGLDTLLGTMNENEEKRILVNVTVGSAWPYSGGLWLGSLRKHGTNGGQMWESATLYSYWKETPVLFFTRNGTTNTWEVTEITKSSDLGGSFRIGDVRQALPNMSAPSADWHECDGTQFDPSAYPVLAGMCTDETTEFNLVANSSLQEILDDLKPNYITDDDYWKTEIIPIYSLQKYYGYTWCTKTATYGNNYELASEIDKCVIFDPKTLTYTIHNATYTKDMRTYGLANNLSAIQYNTADKCFYTDMSVSIYDDDESTLKYLQFEFRKSIDGYTWQSKSVCTNQPIANEISQNVENWRQNTRGQFFILNGKFVIRLHMGKFYKADASSGYTGYTYLFKFDEFSYSTFSAFKFSDAFYISELPGYRDTYNHRHQTVYDIDKGTEELFLVGIMASGTAWVQHISASFQCRWLGPSFNGSSDIWITPLKLSSQYYLIRLTESSRGSGTYESFPIMGIASESALFSSTYQKFEHTDSIKYAGPYYDPKMHIYFGVSNKNMIWWYPGNTTASGEHIDEVFPEYLYISNPPYGSILYGADDESLLVTTKGCYKRAFNKLICKKYPTISVTGLKTFVRQQIS